MMNFDDLFPSKYLKASDFVQPQILTMRVIVEREEFGDGSGKPVVYFNEETRGWVLNKTNSAILKAGYGTPDACIGRQVELFATQVPMQGRVVDAIRCRVPAPAQPVAAPVAPPEAQPAAAPVAPATDAAFPNDKIDF